MQTDQAATANVSERGHNTASASHSRVECTCRCAVSSNSDIRDKVFLTSFCVPGHHTGMRNPLTGSVRHEMEPQASPVSVPCPRSISHGSRYSVNKLEGIVGICLPSTSSVTTDPPEGSNQWDQCKRILIACWTQVVWFPLVLEMLIELPLQIPNIPPLLSQPQDLVHHDPSNLQLYAWGVSGMPSGTEAF